MLIYGASFFFCILRRSFIYLHKPEFATLHTRLIRNDISSAVSRTAVQLRAYVKLHTGKFLVYV